MNTNSRDYEVRVWYSPEPGDECFVAQVVDMPGIMAHGETRKDAAHEIQKALDLALEVYAKTGETPPTPRNPAAAALGRAGGRAVSARKRLAARRNGRKGGRPRKVAA